MVDSRERTISLCDMKNFSELRDSDWAKDMSDGNDLVRPKSELDKRAWDVENEIGAKPEGADGCSELDPLATNGDPEGQSSSKRGSVSSISTGSYDENDTAETGPKWSDIEVRIKLILSTFCMNLYVLSAAFYYYSLWGDTNDLSACERVKLVLFKWIGRSIILLLLLYIFLCSLDLLCSAFRILGGKTAGGVFSNSELLSNPISGLMIGILATVLVQSSSTSTSIIVTMVASGIMEVKMAIPMIMGANIGTSVTNTLVSVTQCSNRREFKRAFAGATVHDMFNWLTVIILLPLEWSTGYLYHMTYAITKSMKMESYKGGKQQLLKALTKPLTSLIVKVDKKVIAKIAEGHEEYLDKSLIKKYCKSDEKNGTERCFSICSQLNDKHDNLIGAILLVISLLILCACLIAMVKLLHSMLQGSIAKMIKKTLNADFPGCFSWLTGYVAILIGAVMTILVQSSSVFTSALTPLVGLNIIKLERMYPLTLGSNIGTTGTGLLAAMAASGDKLPIALQIALCHLFFNISGILIFYPIPFMRRIPIRCAKFLGKVTAEYGWFAVAYLVIMFVLLPSGVFLLTYAGIVPSICVISVAILIASFIIVLNILQKKCSHCLPKCLQTWEFLPKCLRSLEPIDRVIMKVVTLVKSCCPCVRKCCVPKKKKTFTEIVKKAGLDDIKPECKPCLKPSPTTSVASSALLLDTSSLKVQPNEYV